VSRPPNFLNFLQPPEAETALFICCACRSWARQVAAQRPYASFEELVETSDRIWWSLGREDWLEAFAAHPRIGEKGTSLTEEEQSGVRGADAETLAALAEANRLYEARFGHRFIVCATGKHAAEMLELLRARLDNDPETELRVAAEEQRKITNLRMERFFPP
jgi:OHCU decarboxylase